MEGLAGPLKYQEDPKDHKIKPVEIPPHDNTWDAERIEKQIQYTNGCTGLRLMKVDPNNFAIRVQNQIILAPIASGLGVKGKTVSLEETLTLMEKGCYFQAMGCTN